MIFILRVRRRITAIIHSRNENMNIKAARFAGSFFSYIKVYVLKKDILFSQGHNCYIQCSSSMLVSALELLVFE